MITELLKELNKRFPCSFDALHGVHCITVDANGVLWLHVYDQEMKWWVQACLYESDLIDIPGTVNFMACKVNMKRKMSKNND